MSISGCQDVEEWGKGGLLFNTYRILVLQNEKVLEGY